MRPSYDTSLGCSTDSSDAPRPKPPDALKAVLIRANRYGAAAASIFSDGLREAKRNNNCRIGVAPGIA